MSEDKPSEEAPDAGPGDLAGGRADRRGPQGTLPALRRGQAVFRLPDGRHRAAANCGLDYSFADAGDGPAVFVILIIGFVVVGLALWMEVTLNPPLWLHFILWIPLALALCLTALQADQGRPHHAAVPQQGAAGGVGQGRMSGADTLRAAIASPGLR